MPCIFGYLWYNVFMIAKTINLSEMTREQLEEYAVAKATENESLKSRLNWYEEQFRLGRERRFGKSSEKSDGDQISIFNEAEAESDPETEEPQITDAVIRKQKKKKGKGHKARTVSALPRNAVEYTLSDDERACPVCGSTLHPMKKEVRKELAVIPAKVIVTEHVLYSYACRNCDANGINGSIVRANAPKPMFRNSLASASIVADLITKKYRDALPLYRQEQEFHRQGLNLSRQTLSNWVINASEQYLQPVYDILHKDLLEKDIVMADETELEVLREPGRRAEQKSYMWLYRTAGYEKHPIVLYDYKPSRGGDNPKKFLKGFKGYLQTDGYSAYHALLEPESEESPSGVIPVGCMAHLRRKFNDARKAMPKLPDEIANDPKMKPFPSEKGIEYCNRLFAIERESDKAGLSYEERREKREREAGPIMKEMTEWAKNELEKALDKSHLREALSYAVKQAKPLSNYILDGRLEISNNRSERSIKPFVIGRKNWLFSNTPNGANASAVIYSIVETAKENGLDIFEYLKYVFENMTEMDHGHIASLRKLLPYSPELPEKCRISHADREEKTEKPPSKTEQGIVF